MTETNRTTAENGEAPGESRAVRRVAFLGFLLNLALAGVKGVLAFLTGSLAITASAVDSATDSVSSLAAWVGLHFSERRTSSFPLGLYKIENVISVVVALFIFVAGYELARQAALAELDPPDVSLGAVAGLAACVVAVLLFGQYALHVGRRTGSPALRAEGRHRQVDVIATVVVLASAALDAFELHVEIFGLQADRIAAFLVVLFIARAGWELLSDGMRVLLDASLEPETLETVRKVIQTDPLVTEVNSLMGRNAGRYRFVQADVALRTDDLHKAHDASERIEARVREQVKNVVRVVIHVEPHRRDHVRIAVPLRDAEGTLGDHFGASPRYAFLTFALPSAEIESREIVATPSAEAERGKGIRIAEWLVDRDVDAIAMKAPLEHKGPGYVLSSAGVRVETVAGETLEAVLPALKALALDLGRA